MSGGGTIPRGIRDLDMATINGDPYGDQFGGAAASWPATAGPPCHVVVSQGPSGPVPYVLAGLCWYGTEDIAGPGTHSVDQLWAFETGAWVERKPGPAKPGGPVSTTAGFGMVAVDRRTSSASMERCCWTARE